MSKLTVCNHPLIACHLTVLRDKTTPPQGFRAAMDAIAPALIWEATRHVPTQAITVETPLQPTQGHQLNAAHPLVLVPILRAGLALHPAALAALPTAHTYHLGAARNEDTLHPESYYNKLPQTLPGEGLYSNALAWVLDPMLATGGSALWAIQALLERGVPEENLTLVCVLASPEGIKAVELAHPAVRIYSASLDEALNPKGYILPGLGDAGDRYFGTV